MSRIALCLTTIAFIAGSVATASAQTAAPAPAGAPAPTMAVPTAAAPAAKPARFSTAKLKEMRAKWKANKPKLKDCRAQSRSKGLAGDDRWFFIAECMDKT